MKLQHLIVIFVIIIIPIFLAVSMYVQNTVDTIRLQDSYDNMLYNATYDAIKSFQLNTLNNNYSTLNDSKIRDIEASANTFFNSLGTALGYGDNSKSIIKPYIPAIVYTLYDGYYIYSPYRNTYNNVIDSGLKPYIYYSARYVSGNSTDFIVNYTLDNAIVVYGWINANYMTKSGYLLNLDDIGGVELDEEGNARIREGQQLTYKGVTIEKEILKENLIMLDGQQFTDPKEYYYFYGNRTKIYYDSDTKQYFRVSDNKKNVLRRQVVIDSYGVSSGLLDALESGQNYEDSAIEYYLNAYEFTSWVNTNIANISVKDIAPVDGNNQKFYIGGSGNVKIFDIGANNDPSKQDSDFNEHRRAIIKDSIETNLNAAISNYNTNSQALGSTYDFRMPVLSEEEWDKIIGNIGMITFMQGFPLKTKLYNNYCIIGNDKNKELVLPHCLYFVDDTNTYHKLGCQHLEGLEETVTGYNNIRMERQTVKQDDAINYYYPINSKADYDCVIVDTNTTDLDTILNSTDTKYKRQQQIYWTALAREKYNSYRVNDYLNLY